ncbi:MAG: helix-turn-helix domain-containing protein [Puniceicoccales bacterium]|jgi:transcriptional regulator with XRE-family HTH domain|nr:helix-turn-helix domain-containing protein [Puniceicoccales bacterium]
MDVSEMGKVFREARKQRHLTQQELASALRMSRATISNLESGSIHELGFRKLIRLCVVLGLELQVVPEKPETYESLCEKRNAEAEEAQRQTDAILDHYLRPPDGTERNNSHG